jgi:hypothetical protein
LRISKGSSGSSASILGEEMLNKNERGQILLAAGIIPEKTHLRKDENIILPYQIMWKHAK